jgi:hypothetical protein
LKDTIYRVESKADKALILARQDSEDNRWWGSKNDVAAWLQDNWGKKRGGFSKIHLFLYPILYPNPT